MCWVLQYYADIIKQVRSCFLDIMRSKWYPVGVALTTLHAVHIAINVTRRMAGLPVFLPQQASRLHGRHPATASGACSPSARCRQQERTAKTIRQHARCIANWRSWRSCRKGRLCRNVCKVLIGIVWCV